MAQEKEELEKELLDSAEEIEEVEEIDYIDEEDDDVEELDDDFEDEDDLDDEDDEDDEEEADEGGYEADQVQPKKIVKETATSLADLEEEGDIAADYIEELLDIADLGGDLEIDVENGRPSIEIIAEGADLKSLQKLVGEEGEILEALQELSRLAISQKTGKHSRLMLDIAGYRAARRDELTLIATEAVTKARTSGEPVRLQPMNPFERKVCHDVAATEGVYSGSQGQAPNRFVVIYPVSEAELLAEDSGEEELDA